MDVGEDSMDYDAVDEPLAARSQPVANNAANETERNDRNVNRIPVPEDANVNHMKSNEGVVSGYDIEVATDMGENKNEDDIQVHVVPFEMSYIMDNYDGSALTYRLEFVMNHCPPLRRVAGIALVNYLRDNTENTTLYHYIYHLLETSYRAEGEPEIEDWPNYEKEWVTAQQHKFSQRHDFLQNEFKKQTEDGVKEPTRRAMEDLFQHYMKNGRIPEALRLYTRGMREYCTQFKHSIQMYVNYLEGSLLLNDFVKVETLVSTAYKTVRDAENAEKAVQPTSSGRPVPFPTSSTASRPLQTPKQLIDSATAKITAADVITNLHSGRYRVAAEKILEIKVEHLQPKWLVSATDLGAYATLCALASFSRVKLKQQMGTHTFRKLLDSEPIYVEMMQCFVKSQFERVVDIFNAVRNKLLLDPYISAHVDILFKKIKERILIQFLEPFSTVKVERVAHVMRTTPKDIETVLIYLLEKGELKITIDRKTGIIRNKQPVSEAAEFARVIDVCDSLLIKSSLVLSKAAVAHANSMLIADKDSKLKRKPEDDISEPIESSSKTRSSSRNRRDVSLSPEMSASEKPDLVASVESNNGEPSTSRDVSVPQQASSSNADVTSESLIDEPLM